MRQGAEHMSLVVDVDGSGVDGYIDMCLFTSTVLTPARSRIASRILSIEAQNR